MKSWILRGQRGSFPDHYFMCFFIFKMNPTVDMMCDWFISRSYWDSISIEISCKKAQGDLTCDWFISRSYRDSTCVRISHKAALKLMFRSGAFRTTVPSRRRNQSTGMQ